MSRTTRIALIVAVVLVLFLVLVGVIGGSGD
jgi:hypothetical protein